METYLPLLKGPQPIASHLREQKNARYRALADYEKTAQTYLLLEDVNWQLVRELILQQWQQVKADVRRAFFHRQNGPDYIASRHDKRRGAYPSRLIYLPHEFYPLSHYCLLALDRTGRVPVGTMAPYLKPEIRLATEEREGYEYLARKQQAHPDARAQVAGDLLRVAQVISHNPALNILLELGTPRLSQLSSGAGNALGYATYFLECWQRFHEYEQVPPANLLPLIVSAQLRAEIDYTPAELSATSATAKNLLPPDVADRHAYLSSLLGQCAVLLKFEDITTSLRNAFEVHQSRGLYEAEDFLAKLPAYANKLLPPETYKELSGAGGLFQGLHTTLRLFKATPETWPRWGTADRPRLEARRQDLAQRLALAEQGSNVPHVVERWREVKGEKAAAAIEKAQQKKRAADLAELPAMLAHIDSILAALDTAAAAGIALVTSGLLATPRPSYAALTLPNSTQPKPDAPTVADLCRNGFTPADLTNLLLRLAVVDAGGTSITNELRGKARGQRGAFTAAYRVLHRAELLAPTATDKLWAAAFQNEYGVTLGADVIAHQLTPHGHAQTLAPGPFRKAVADATEWVNVWKSRR